MKEFVDQYLLNKHEEMEWVNEEDNPMFGYIIRRTPRTYRRIARLFIAKEVPSTIKNPSKQLMDTRMSVHRAKKLSFSSDQKAEWILAGWIVRRVELSDDGRTALATKYLMGPALHKYIAEEEKKKRCEQISLFHSLQNQLKECAIPDGFKQLNHRIKYLLKIDFDTFENDPLLVEWSYVKRIKFMQFLIALLSIREQKNSFDFKEIGATYYKEIGGSKVFDRYREDFIELLEEWLGDDIQSIGLISQGKIMPIYFAGHVEGRFATYDIGSLHAITDVALLQESFTTASSVLWLVENRAMLTRMSASVDFMKDTSSLIICLDGHMRSAQRKFIQQIHLSKTIEQVIIWTDYDLSGLLIAHEAYEVLKKPIRVKWIAANGEVYFSYDKYAKWLKEKIKTTKREQEEILGDEHIWKKWINT